MLTDGMFMAGMLIEGILSVLKKFIVPPVFPAGALPPPGGRMFNLDRRAASCFAVTASDSYVGETEMRCRINEGGMEGDDEVGTICVAVATTARTSGGR